jgi:hypothetical protein
MGEFDRLSALPESGRIADARLMAVVGGLPPDSHPATNLQKRTFIHSYWRPSTTCVARSVAVDFITR